MSDDFISIESNIEDFIQQLDDAAKTQIPYATALAINDLARRVIKGEKAELLSDFPTATPFTQNAFSYSPATKNAPVATVFVKDIQEKYLQPYTDHGKSIPAGPGNVAMLVPKGIGVNQYGNIPYGRVRSMKNKKNVFSGTIKTKSGQTIGGVFQRINGRKGGPRLKILVRFNDPVNVKQNFYFDERAKAVVEANVQDALEQALLKALGSMK